MHMKPEIEVMFNLLLRGMYFDRRCH